MKLSEVKIGGAFTIGGIEFIKFSEENGVAVSVTKDKLHNSTFGNNNDFSKSKILKNLQADILPKLEDAVGAENILEFETDLLSLDGSDIYGKMKSKISLPTFDFYRANVKIFDQYKRDDWWWLSTPDSTKDHVNDYWIVCVSPRGSVDYDYFNLSRGVRPVLHFVSSISVSCED